MVQAIQAQTCASVRVDQNQDERKPKVVFGSESKRRSRWSNGSSVVAINLRWRLGAILQSDE